MMTSAITQNNMETLMTIRLKKLVMMTIVENIPTIQTSHDGHGKEFGLDNMLLFRSKFEFQCKQSLKFIKQEIFLLNY